MIIEGIQAAFSKLRKSEQKYVEKMEKKTLNQNKYLDFVCTFVRIFDIIGNILR